MGFRFARRRIVCLRSNTPKVCGVCDVLLLAASHLLYSTLASVQGPFCWLGLHRPKAEMKLTLNEGAGKNVEHKKQEKSKLRLFVDFFKSWPHSVFVKWWILKIVWFITQKAFKHSMWSLTFACRFNLTFFVMCGFLPPFSITVKAKLYNFLFPSKKTYFRWVLTTATTTKTKTIHRKALINPHHHHQQHRQQHHHQV